MDKTEQLGLFAAEELVDALEIKAGKGVWKFLLCVIL